MHFELQADRVRLFEFLNNIGAKLLPDFPTFEHYSDSFFLVFSSISFRTFCASVTTMGGQQFEQLLAAEQLPAAERAYLLKLSSLPGGGLVKAQAKCIDDHVLTYPPAAGAPPSAAGGAGGGAGGGGAGGPPTLPQGLGGLVLALLVAEYASALGRLPRPEMTRLLTAAGVPTSDSDTLDGVRNNVQQQPGQQGNYDGQATSARYQVPSRQWCARLSTFPTDGRQRQEIRHSPKFWSHVGTRLGPWTRLRASV